MAEKLLSDHVIGFWNERALKRADVSLLSVVDGVSGAGNIATRLI